MNIKYIPKMVFQLRMVDHKRVGTIIGGTYSFEIKLSIFKPYKTYFSIQYRSVISPLIKYLKLY